MLNTKRWIFISWSRWRKIGRLSISMFLFIVVIDSNTDFTKTYILTNSIYSQSLVKILQRSDKDKITFKASEKLYRNTLN